MVIQNRFSPRPRDTYDNAVAFADVLDDVPDGTQDGAASICRPNLTDDDESSLIPDEPMPFFGEIEPGVGGAADEPVSAAEAPKETRGIGPPVSDFTRPSTTPGQAGPKKWRIPPEFAEGGHVESRSRETAWLRDPDSPEQRASGFSHAC